MDEIGIGVVVAALDLGRESFARVELDGFCRTADRIGGRVAVSEVVVRIDDDGIADSALSSGMVTLPRCQK